jgi:hypothetical protein
VIVAEFDLIGISVFPDKTDSPLIVDAHGMLTCTTALQRLKTIAGRHAQIIKADGSVESHQFPSRPLYDVSRKVACITSQEQAPRLLVAKANDHQISVSENDTNINADRAVRALLGSDQLLLPVDMVDRHACLQASCLPIFVTMPDTNNQNAANLRFAIDDQMRTVRVNSHWRNDLRPKSSRIVAKHLEKIAKMEMILIGLLLAEQPAPGGVYPADVIGGLACQAVRHLCYSAAS